MQLSAHYLILAVVFILLNLDHLLLEAVDTHSLYRRTLQ